MMNHQTLLGTGILRTFANGVAHFIVSAVPGKLYGFSTTSANAAAVYAQLFDATTLAGAESGGTWTTPPFYQAPAPGALNASGAGAEIMFDPPLVLQNGLVILLSTSSTAYAADGSPVIISASFVPDNPSTLGSTVPA
jgi:hypothetical protein